jgi:hypothetical protein
VAAYVDASYFQGVPYGYTPSMAVRMNNSWGSNRSLELKMTFTSPAYGPYRNVRVVLARDGSTLCDYAISDSNPLRSHFMEIFETYETSTDGYWDAYFDHACLTDGDPVAGPVKWYLHDHGTTSETKVTCPSYPQGEWAHFYDIQILDRYWDWTHQLAPYWPVTVVDDNAYFDLHWVIPNDHWLVRTTSRADDDASWEVGTWAQYYSEPNGTAGISPYLDDGFRSQFPGGWVPYVHDTYPAAYQPGIVMERDLREAGFDPYEPGLPGTAATGFDRPDFALWVSHGSTNTLQCNPVHPLANPLVYEDRINFEQQYARWGKTDLEWVYVVACSYTGWGGEQWRNDYSTMAGLHVMCGFANEMLCPADNPANPLNGDDYKYGRDLVLYMKGQKDGVNHTIVEAFELQAKDFHDGDELVRCFFTPTTLFDHLPDYGSFSITDPVGWMMGGPTYYRNSET